jgi:hypothetical protein
MRTTRALLRAERGPQSAERREHEQRALGARATRSDGRRSVAIASTTAALVARGVTQARGDEMKASLSKIWPLGLVAFECSCDIEPRRCFEAA